MRVNCLAKSMNKWDESSPDCSGNDWLRDRIDNQWTLTPFPDGTNAFVMLSVYSIGNVNTYGAFIANAVRPVAYLKSSVKIKTDSASDYGSITNPFVIQ